MLQNFKKLSGTANGVTAGSYVNGPIVAMPVREGRLLAKVDVDAETNGLTFSLLWQGSNAADFSSPTDLAFNAANSAAAVIATGTAGADAAVRKALPAPHSAAGFKFVRCRLLVGGATGTTNDTYSIGYYFVEEELEKSSEV